MDNTHTHTDKFLRKDTHSKTNDKLFFKQVVTLQLYIKTSVASILRIFYFELQN